MKVKKKRVKKETKGKARGWLLTNYLLETLTSGCPRSRVSKMIWRSSRGRTRRRRFCVSTPSVPVHNRDNDNDVRQVDTWLASFPCCCAPPPAPLLVWPRSSSAAASSPFGTVTPPLLVYDNSSYLATPSCSRPSVRLLTILLECLLIPSIHFH